MEFTIRQATPRDAKILAKLCGTVQKLHVAAVPDRYRPYIENNKALEKQFRDWLRRRHQIGLIAETATQPIGYALIQVLQSKDTPLTYGHRFVYIDQMSVETDWHRKGVGSALMKEITRIGHQNNARFVTLEVAEHNGAAQKFYQAQGFAFSFHTMKHELE